MSTLFSGRVCWAAIVALLLSHASAVANPAILVRPTDAGFYDVSLDITQLELLPGLADWDDLAFTSLTTPVLSEHAGNLTREEWEELAVVDIASGTRCSYTPGCMDEISSHYQSLRGSDLTKRVFFVSAWRFVKWTTRKTNALKAGGLGALSSTISGVGDGIIKLSRAAICQTDNGDQACISWGGAAHAIKKSIALDIIKSGQGTFGGEAISGEEYAAIFETSSKRRMKRTSYNVCLSSVATCPT